MIALLRIRGKQATQVNEWLKKQYRLEKALAEKLLHSSKEQRPFLYSSVYEEFYGWMQKFQPSVVLNQTPKELSRQLQFLSNFISKDAIFLEIGPGDLSLSFEIASRIKKVYAIDAYLWASKEKEYPQNFHLTVGSGVGFSVPDSIDTAYTHQVVEHLHPEDLDEHLRTVYLTLKSGGTYVCITPNRLNGPHDVSKFFAKVASGLHLKEYTTGELAESFKKAGFHRIRAFYGVRNYYMGFPVLPVKLFESLFGLLPKSVRAALSDTLPVRILMGIRLTGQK